MKKDSAIVIFCTVACLAMLCWKMNPVKLPPVALPKPDDEPKTLPVAVDASTTVRPAWMMAAPYVFLPPLIPYVENRESDRA